MTHITHDSWILFVNWPTAFVESCQSSNTLWKKACFFIKEMIELFSLCCQALTTKWQTAARSLKYVLVLEFRVFGLRKTTSVARRISCCTAGHLKGANHERKLIHYSLYPPSPIAKKAAMFVYIYILRPWKALSITSLLNRRKVSIRADILY